MFAATTPLLIIAMLFLQSKRGEAFAPPRPTTPTKGGQNVGLVRGGPAGIIIGPSGRARPPTTCGWTSSSLTVGPRDER